MIFGTEITKDMVIADPDWPKNKVVTDSDLSAFTMKLHSKYEQDAIKMVNGMKEEYGNGVSTLVTIYNATAHSVKYHNSHDWSGHMWKYSSDDEILNGQWSVFLHVKHSGTATGSVAAVIYRVDTQDCDLFLGWDSPFSGSPSVYVEAREKDHWPGKGSWSYMEWQLEKAGSTGHSGEMGRDIRASTGDSSSPIARYLLG